MKKVVLLFSLMLLFSCADKAMEKPDNLIEKDVMIDILFDIVVLQAAESTNAAQFAQKGLKPNEFIYGKYKIDSVTFAKSNRYYASDPHNYQKMFAKVSERIKNQQETLNQKAIEQTGNPIAPSDAPAIQ
ncbi:DUF4296 domain-containing protein [Flavobacterium pedocola]